MSNGYTTDDLNVPGLCAKWTDILRAHAALARAGRIPKGDLIWRIARIAFREASRIDHLRHLAQYAETLNAGNWREAKGAADAAAALAVAEGAADAYADAYGALAADAAAAYAYAYAAAALAADAAVDAVADYAAAYAAYDDDVADAADAADAAYAAVDAAAAAVYAVYTDAAYDAARRVRGEIVAMVLDALQQATAKGC